jgi:hypothetical protein
MFAKLSASEADELVLIMVLPQPRGTYTLTVYNTEVLHDMY